MVAVGNIFAIVLMALIFVFAGTHLGVSIGIIIPYRKYGDVFRPQIGLSAFNIVVSFFGFVTSILGLVSIFMSSKIFGRVVCAISGVLGICALASLVAAIILNFQSLNFITNQFSSSMRSYDSNTNAHNSISFIQTTYTCCGADIWIDWVHAGLNSTSPVTSTTSTITTNTTTVPARNLRNVKKDTIHVSDNRRSRNIVLRADSSRQKRQVITTYGGIEGLPIDFSVTLPSSCCVGEATYTGNPADSYCISNANKVANHFNTAGCVKPLDVVASIQLMGIGIINSFMVVLAFVAIPVLFKKVPTSPAASPTATRVTRSTASE